MGSMQDRYLSKVLKRIGEGTKVEVCRSGWNDVKDLVVGFSVSVGGGAAIEIYFRDDEYLFLKVLEFLKEWKEKKEMIDVVVWVDDEYGLYYEDCVVESILIPYALASEFGALNKVGQVVVLKYKKMKIVKRGEV
jgi:hypothetical protein